MSVHMTVARIHSFTFFLSFTLLIGVTLSVLEDAADPGCVAEVLHSGTNAESSYSINALWGTDQDYSYK